MKSLLLGLIVFSLLMSREYLGSLPTTRVPVKDVTLHDHELYEQFDQSVQVADDNRLNGKLIVVKETFTPGADEIALMLVFALIVAGFHFALTPAADAASDERHSPT